MRGFTVNGVKFRVEAGGYLATVGKWDGWVFIKPKDGAYEYSASVITGLITYVTNKPVKEVALEILRTCARNAARAHEAFRAARIDEEK